MNRESAAGRAFLVRVLPLSVGLGIGVILLWLLLRTVNPTRLGLALSHADRLLLLASFVPFVAIVSIKLVRWRLLFGDDAPRLSVLFGALTAGYAANTLVPLRLGELVTVYWIRDSEGISMVRSLATIAVERVSDGLAVALLLFVTAPTVAFPHTLLIPALALTLLLVIAVAVLATLTIVLSSREHGIEMWLTRVKSRRIGSLAGFIRQIANGLSALRNPRAVALFLLYTLSIWASNAVLLWLICRAFHLDVPLIAGFLLTGVLYLGMAVPSSPGYIGVFDYLMVLTLGLYGEPHARTVAAAFAAHVINFVPVTLIGLVYLARHGFVQTLRLASPAPGEKI